MAINHTLHGLGVIADVVIKEKIVTHVELIDGQATPRTIIAHIQQVPHIKNTPIHIPIVTAANIKDIPRHTTYGANYIKISPLSCNHRKEGSIL
jgi:hypothetical protein